MMTSWALGNAAAIFRDSSGGVMASWAPTMTSVGTVIDASRPVRSGRCRHPVEGMATPRARGVHGRPYRRDQLGMVAQRLLGEELRHHGIDHVLRGAVRLDCEGQLLAIPRGLGRVGGGGVDQHQHFGSARGNAR